METLKLTLRLQTILRVLTKQKIILNKLKAIMSKIIIKVC